MDLTILLLAAGCLAAGVVAGWLLRASRDRGDAAASARVAAAEATATAARQELERAYEAAREREERAQRDEALLRALAPVGDALTTMRQRIDESERERHGQYGALAEQLRRAHEADEQLRRVTSELSGALRSGSARGVWGETQLRRIVESAGLLRHVDFDLQTTIANDAGAGRPDLVVRLPGGRSLAVDAKAPLDAFLEAAAIPETTGGELGERRRMLVAKHGRAVRAHVDALAKRYYWTGFDASPEFVVCFLPSESLLSAAVTEDPALLEYAFSRRVALASPVNLWALLKTVAQTWGHEEVSADARRLLALGTELHGRLGTLAGHADDLRRAIDRTVDSYNRFVGTLESRVLVTARRFPGVDGSRLGDGAAGIERTTRPFTAPELVADPASAPRASADLDAVRARLDEHR